ncbi:hypothetical protein [Nocardia sp. GAS34]|uniref:hypothetical protein n=1 Tax=unclassified Nocardia TaxID=2637762 RepID=UPI003D239FC6
MDSPYQQHRDGLDAALRGTSALLRAHEWIPNERERQVADLLSYIWDPIAEAGSGEMPLWDRLRRLRAHSASVGLAVLASGRDLDIAGTDPRGLDDLLAAVAAVTDQGDILFRRALACSDPASGDGTAAILQDMPDLPGRLGDLERILDSPDLYITLGVIATGEVDDW